MSDPHNEHEAGIRTPKQLIIAIVAGFLVPIIAIVLLVQYVTNTPNEGAGSTSQSNEAIVARIRPIADQNFTLKDASAPRVFLAGAEVYKSVCAGCHAVGAAGAPKTGDVAAWSPRISKGYETLVSHAINGINAMPAKGGNSDLDDIEVARAVAYLANQAGAKFTEPEAKATPAVLVTSDATSAAATLPVANTVPVVKVVEAVPPAISVESTPVVAVAATATPVSATNLSVDAGKKLYEGVCQACHGAGIAGAPKFGDKMAWAERIKKGAPVLYEHAIKGYQGKAGIMPPKGGSTATDDEVKAAVDYMSAAAK
jgi:cytochrome c5